MIYRHNTVLFDINKAQTFGGAQYAPGDLLKNQDKWAALGITAEADPVYPDPALFSWIYDYATPGGTLIVTPLDSAVIAANTAAEKYVTDAAAAKTSIKLTALMGMNPAQVQVWVAANVTTLAQAQDAIATLAIAVAILARRM
jgi:hypothetical protein